MVAPCAPRIGVVELIWLPGSEGEKGFYWRIVMLSVAAVGGLLIPCDTTVGSWSIWRGWYVGWIHKYLPDAALLPDICRQECLPFVLIGWHCRQCCGGKRRQPAFDRCIKLSFLLLEIMVTWHYLIWPVPNAFDMHAQWSFFQFNFNYLTSCLQHWFCPVKKFDVECSCLCTSMYIHITRQRPLY